MRGSFTFEERVALWVLGALLACVAVAFVFAANQAGAAEAPPVPKAMPTPAPNYRTWFFAATAKDKDGLESDFSDELSLTETSRIATVTLAWDQSVSWSPSNPLTYRVYCGGKSRTYTNIVEAGTNLTAQVRLRPPRLTNWVVTVTGTGGLWFAQSTCGPWEAMSATSMVLTNPQRSGFWRTETGRVAIAKEVL
ncbi:MAG TPA: hypothetical protein PLU91_03115 [Verrucomicrobiota bacterium]|jgi:hypothetical protein|nr:hypothetical protein [Verrucomicrobiota bacterium]